MRQLPAVPEIMKRNMRLIWQTERADFETATAAGRAFAPSSLCIRRFIDRMEFAYAVSPWSFAGPAQRRLPN